MQSIILDVWKRHVVDGGDSAALAGVPPGDMIDVCTVKVSRTQLQLPLKLQLQSFSSLCPHAQVSKRDAQLGLPVEQFAAVAKTLCGFPSFFAAPLFRRIRVMFDPKYARKPVARGSTEPFDAAQGVDTDGVVTLELFLRYWSAVMEPKDHVDRY